MMRVAQVRVSPGILSNSSRLAEFRSMRAFSGGAGAAVFGGNAWLALRAWLGTIAKSVTAATMSDRLAGVLTGLLSAIGSREH